MLVGEAGRALHLEALTPQGMGDTHLWRGDFFGHLQPICLKPTQRITFVTSLPRNTSRLKMHFEERFKQFFPLKSVYAYSPWIPEG